MEDNLLRLLSKVKDIGEVINVLQRLRRRPLEFWVLNEKIMRRASLCVISPQPDILVQLALNLDLIKKSDSGFFLSKLGRRLLEIDRGIPDRVNPEQGKLILPSLLDDEELRTAFEDLTGLFIKSFKFDYFYIYPKKNLDTNISSSLLLLQQLGLAEYDKPYVTISSNNLALVNELLENPKGVTEKEFKRLLERREHLSILAEKYVLEYEKKRLVKEGFSHLATLIKRVSEDSISEGFDILSFNSDGSKRFIEVKSSVGYKVRFEWSQRQKQIALESRENYWIYFIPHSLSLPKLDAEPVLIQDPISLLGKKLFEYTSNWLVRGV